MFSNLVSTKRRVSTVLSEESREKKTLQTSPFSLKSTNTKFWRSSCKRKYICVQSRDMHDKPSFLATRRSVAKGRAGREKIVYCSSHFTPRWRNDNRLRETNITSFIIFRFLEYINDLILSKNDNGQVFSYLNKTNVFYEFQYFCCNKENIRSDNTKITYRLCFIFCFFKTCAVFMDEHFTYGDKKKKKST